MDSWNLALRGVRCEIDDLHYCTDGGVNSTCLTADNIPTDIPAATDEYKRVQHMQYARVFYRSYGTGKIHVPRIMTCIHCVLEYVHVLPGYNTGTGRIIIYLVLQYLLEYGHSYIVPLYRSVPQCCNTSTCIAIYCTGSWQLLLSILQYISIIHIHVNTYSTYR